ncbi:MAG: type II secretion system F family protein [Patescibacteria group bacterium]|nr:type II secretion system F family protein [Patescibacteria group bacterium]
MAIFIYKARDINNKIKKGKVVAANQVDAVRVLKKKKMSVVYLKDFTNSIEFKITSFLAPIKGKDLVVFSRQFSIMMMANVPIIESLKVIIEQTNNIKFKNIISEIAYDVDNGLFLSDALKKHPHVFSTFYANVIKAGETSGKLDEVLNYLADEVEKDYDLSKKFRGALIYPIFVCTGLVIVGFIFLFFVLPELTKILQETGARLPLSTRMIIGVADFLQNYYILLIVLIVGGAVALKLFFKTKLGKRNRDIFLVKAPIIGKIFQLIYLIRFSRSLRTLLRGGITVTRSLSIVGDIVRNTVYKDIITETIDDINEGGSIVTVLENSDYVPKMIPEMMSIGEKTGHLDDVLEEIAKFYDKEVRVKLDNLNTMLEPIIMVVMGIGVGIMVAAVIMPMYNIASQF